MNNDIEIVLEHDRASVQIKIFLIKYDPVSTVSNAPTTNIVES